MLLAAAMIGIINAFVRPIVLLLTLPLSILTLGLFVLVVNALMLVNALVRRCIGSRPEATSARFSSATASRMSFKKMRFRSRR